MRSRGTQIRRASLITVVACLVAAPIAIAASGDAPAHDAVTAKKCKRKHHGRKHRCRRAVPAPASIAISPTSQDFGLVPVNSKTTRTFTITNAGGSPSGVPLPTIMGPNADSFSIAFNTCYGSLPPAGTCRVDVDLPFADPFGMRAGTLNVAAVPGGTVSAAMTGDIEI
jgi:hypothetical protein